MATELILNHFKTLFPRCKNPSEFTAALNEFMPQAGIDNPRRVSAFLAQCGHECAKFTRFEENLNYSAKALRAVFGKYFKDDETANEYARQPEKIANRVYANRMKNGDEASGDGFKYRGRGVIQLTGKANYMAFTNDTGHDIVGNPDKVLQDKKMLVATAIWFWHSNNLNRYADNADDFVTLTKKINGGTHGLKDRQAIYEKSVGLFGLGDSDAPTHIERPRR